MDALEKLEKGYEIASWKDNPWSSEGRERYRAALEKFNTLLKHPWLAEVAGKDKVDVLDLGAGRGIGGVALAKVLMSRGLKVKIVMVDLRESR